METYNRPSRGSRPTPASNEKPERNDEGGVYRNPSTDDYSHWSGPTAVGVG